MPKLILAIDQGTTGSKAMLVDADLKILAEKTTDFEQHYPKPGWVEHDPNEIWNSVLTSIQAVLKKQNPKDIIAIGITNQRETLVFWDKKTGKTLSNAIVWQDRRTADQCEQLKAKGAEPFFQESTGLLLDPYFSGTKAAWALKNWDDVKAAQKSKRLAAGTIDSFLIAKLSGIANHVTEPSNASRTLCFNIKTHQWDTNLCATLGIPPDIWPEVRPSVGTFGLTQGVPGLPDGVPISGVLGDQQAALLGQACIKEGTAKCTYGTGSFILLNTGNKPVTSRHRLLTTIAWALSPTDYTYALEGSAFIAGAAVQWLRDGLKLFKNSYEIEKMAETVSDTGGLTFVPALTGLGAPHWDPHASGLITGITRGTTDAHLARAALEGIAFQNADILTAMQKDLGKPILSLNVDGGACSNNLLMQIQSDLLGCELKRPQMIQTTSLGAIFAAGIGVGLWSNLAAIEQTWKKDRDFKPAITATQREAMLKRWGMAVGRTMFSPK